jgi:hypothetical protein
MFHWSGKRVTLSHAKLVRQFSNVLLLEDEYVLWILSHFNAQIVLPPNTHLQTWRSLQPTWCVLGGKNLSLDPLSPQSRLLPSRPTPREAKGGRPY